MNIQEIYDFNKKITLFIKDVTIGKVIGLVFDNSLDFRLKENVIILEKIVVK